ncbi:fumarylacetoacetate hydrolase family protein [Kerstersia similis]|uniref:fumarylacetoacetate hydrolase family protein n=1 Tax=Kerstersia similis TaxID=206505 RepID=UPI0039EE17D0
MTSSTHPSLSDATRGTLFGIALNYRGLLDSRLEEFQQPPYQRPPVKPVLFIKTPNTRNQDGGQVAKPHDARLQPGPALGVVIGKRASRVKAADAMSHVAGYVIVNEFSLPEDSYYRPAVKAKCRDGFCAIGPALVPAADIADVNQLGLRVFVNGELRQQNSTANWVRTIPELIETLSEFMTLNEGDVLITGTPEGRVDVEPGDEVIVEIDGLGKLRNVVVQEQEKN